MARTRHQTHDTAHVEGSRAVQQSMERHDDNAATTDQQRRDRPAR